MRVTYDPAKRIRTLADRGVVCYGMLEGRMVVVGYTPRVARFATSSACGKPMTVNKPALRRTSKSDMARVDAHRIKPAEYEELPELTDEMLARAVVRKGGRPRSTNPRQLISLRLPADVISRWRATGPGWQTRMAERLSKVTAGSRRKRGT